MSDLQTLFLVVLLLYLTQCIHWIPEGCVAFREAVKRPWKMLPVQTGFTLLGRQPVFTNPLPPFAGVAVCQPLPFRVSPAGIAEPEIPSVYRAGLRGEPAKGARFREIRDIQASGETLRIDGAVFVKVSCAAQAQHLAAFLCSLHRSREKDRGSAIETELAGMLDVERISARLRAYRELSRGLAVSCHALFIFFFALAPLAIWRFGLAWSWRLLTAILVIFLVLIAFQFRRARKKIHADTAEFPWPVMVSLLLSPFAAIRARDALVQDLFCAFHPLAVTRVLCDEAAFRSAASTALREAFFFIASPQGGMKDSLSGVEEWHRSRELTALKKFIARAGEDPEKLLGPPPRESELCQSYCPRCWAQFALQSGNCEPCGGMPLRPFPGQTELS